MPIDASIPLGYKPVQTPNMLAAAAQGQEMSLNALKMQEAGQTIADREFVKSLDPNAPDYINRLSQRLPEVGAKVQKSRTEARTAGLDQQIKIGTLLKTSATSVIANPTFENAVMALQNFSKATGEDVTSEFNTLQKIGNNPEALTKWASGYALSADQMLTPDIRNFNFGEQNPKFRNYQMDKARAGASKVVLPEQEKEFEKELGSGQAKRISKSVEGAEDAAAILATNQIGRDILSSGAITGSGADFFVGLNQALKTAGIDAGYADASANSQAYGATMASNVGKLIKQYGAGTGLSDADREFATKAAAGSVNMDEKAIRRVLDINDRAARYVINSHNKKVEGIKTNIPLKVEIPGGKQPMYATNGTQRIVSNDGGATWQPVGAK